MKFCLALMFQTEADWLRLHLPVLMQANIDGLVALDGGSDDDSRDVIFEFGGHLFTRQFDWHFGNQGNYLIECCQKAGCDAMLRLDPDELMFPEDINRVRELLETDKTDLVILPRFNFTKDRLHWQAESYPDYQQRAWLLNRGVHYQASVHEVPHHPNLRIHHAAGLNIFHYGDIRYHEFRAWRHAMYIALQNGDSLPPKPESFSDGQIGWPPQERFDKPQPLEFREVGLRAPLSSPHNLHLTPNLTGDRTVEYNWVTTHIPPGKGLALDFGSGGVAHLSQAALSAGYDVVALDVQLVSVPPRVVPMTGDVLDETFLNQFDLLQFNMIICCSTIEHIGLAGRYGVTVGDPDGDLKAMLRLKAVLAPGGWLLLTLPVGLDAVHKPMHRVYGKRLAELIDGLEVVCEEYWTKHSGAWTPCKKDYALSTASISVSKTDWQGSLYNIGCLLLRKYP